MKRLNRIQKYCARHSIAVALLIGAAVASAQQAETQDLIKQMAKEIQSGQGAEAATFNPESLMLPTQSQLTPSLNMLRQGGQDGGGGGVIRCEKVDQVPTFGVRIVDGKKVYYRIKPPSALPNQREFEFIDLWEAETGIGPFFHHMTKLKTAKKADRSAYFERALKRLAEVDQTLASEVRKYQVYISCRSFPAPKGTYVLPPEDTDIRFLPVGCYPLGLGLYSDRQDNLVYDAQVMARLPAIDQAAFDVHEALYKTLREHTGAQDSWQTRRIVGLLFSDEKITPDELKPEFQW